MINWGFAMTLLNNFLNTSIQLHILWILFIALAYIVIHNNRLKPVNQFLDIYLNYIPVLTHEFGHILFNKISGGKAKDLVIVALPKERQATSQQGYAITQSKGLLGQAITTLGGYIMPPFMLYLSFLAVELKYPSIFIFTYLVIFIYFLVLTSRKFLPIIIIILLIILLYFLLQNNDPIIMTYIVPIVYHFIVGVLLGEVLQSSWTIVNLTFNAQSITWDGSTLKDLTHIPTFIFSIVWIAINLLTVYHLFGHYLPW